MKVEDKGIENFASDNRFFEFASKFFSLISTRRNGSKSLANAERLIIERKVS